MARYALASIPGPAADEALREGLGHAPNQRVRIGIIGSLGCRKDTKSVPALVALISFSDEDLTGAVVAALANIADRHPQRACRRTPKAGGQVRTWFRILCDLCRSPAARVIRPPLAFTANDAPANRP